MQIGAHVDQSDPVAEAAAREISVVQFFLGNPQGYKAPVVAHPDGAAGLRAAAQEADLTQYVHAPYLINVASTNNRIRIPSRKLLQQHVDAATAIGAAGLIVHGGHVGDADELEKGFDNWRKAIEATNITLPLLIENTAGGDHAMSRRLENIARLWDAISAADGFDQVGFCLDTCHAHAGGADLSTVVDQVRAITGRIDLVHLNDSRDAADSGADRHANLGAGQIPAEALVAIAQEADAPLLLETPGGPVEHRSDIDWLLERL